METGSYPEPWKIDKRKVSRRQERLELGAADVVVAKPKQAKRAKPAAEPVDQLGLLG
jgi:hypothetical protein